MRFVLHFLLGKPLLGLRLRLEGFRCACLFRVLAFKGSGQSA